MLKIIVIIVLVVVAGVLIFASTKPDTFSITRKIKINATPEKVFAEVNDFHNWKSWSPYETKDPAMQRTFSGAPLGVGTIYEWNGNNDVGQGRMEINESVAAQKILIKLDFFKPFEAHNVAEFTFTQEGNETLVVWEMRGPQVFIGKLMGVFMNIDKMVGSDFEVGLAKLKQISETNN